MSESLTDLGLALVCETCESEIDFDDDLGTEVGICRQCGMAFLVDVSDIVDEADARPGRSA